MGDCSEVFIGLTQYFIHAINRNADIDKLNRFEIHIYTDDVRGNVFSNIKEYVSLKDYLAEQKLFVVNGTTMNTLEGILSKNIQCYFHKDNGKNYEYAHISFYEMESEITSEQATMNQIETGISLNGICQEFRRVSMVINIELGMVPNMQAKVRWLKWHLFTMH